MSGSSAGASVASSAPPASPPDRRRSSLSKTSPSVLTDMLKTMKDRFSSPIRKIIDTTINQVNSFRGSRDTTPAAAQSSASASMLDMTFDTWQAADLCVRSEHHKIGRRLRLGDQATDKRAVGSNGNKRVLLCADVLCQGRIVIARRGELWKVIEDTIAHAQCSTTAKVSTRVLAQDPTFRANILSGSGMSLKQAQVLASTAGNVNGALSTMQASRVRVRIVNEERAQQNDEYKLLPALLREIVTQHKGGAVRLCTRTPADQVCQRSPRMLRTLCGSNATNVVAHPVARAHHHLLGHGSRRRRRRHGA